MTCWRSITQAMLSPELMVITEPDSKRTSTPLPSIGNPYRWLTRAPHEGDSALEAVILRPNRGSLPGLYRPEVIVNPPAQLPVADTTEGGDTYYIVDKTRGALWQPPYNSPSVFDEGSAPYEAVWTWTVVIAKAFGSVEPGIRSALAEMRELAASVRRGDTIESNDEIDALLARAVESRGAPGDIDEWARRVASTVGNFDD